MKFDPTKPVRARDGRAARIICTDRAHLNYPIVALVKNRIDAAETVLVYTENGHLKADCVITDADLINT